MRGAVSDVWCSYSGEFRKGGPASFLGNLTSRLDNENVLTCPPPKAPDSASSRPGDHAGGLGYEYTYLHHKQHWFCDCGFRKGGLGG